MAKSRKFVGAGLSGEEGAECETVGGGVGEIFMLEKSLKVGSAETVGAMGIGLDGLSSRLYDLVLIAWKLCCGGASRRMEPAFLFPSAQSEDSDL